MTLLVGKTMTIEELRRVFDSEWVLLEDPVTNSLMEVQSGKLLFHAKDRKELDRKILEIRPKNSALFYTGSWPEDLVVAL